MSFAINMNKAVEDFKAKFATQHREAMQHQFTTNFGELTELGIQAAEKVAMIKDSHKSLNEAENALGLPLTPLPKLGNALDGYNKVVALAETKRRDEPGEVRKSRENASKYVARVRRAVRKFDEVRTTHTTAATYAQSVVERREVTRLMVEARDNTGMSFKDIGLAVGRSATWGQTFVSTSRRMGLG